jgi:hypothetical protein
MPRPRKKKEEPVSWGMHIFTTLVGGALSLALIWGGSQFVMVMMNQMTLNMQLSSAQGLVKPWTTQWNMKSSVEHKAGFTCDDKENPCPSFENEYTSDKPVTVKQMEALVPGTNKMTGDCQTPVSGKALCETTSKSGIFEYHAYVEEIGEGKGYLIVISAHPPKS